MLAEKNIGNDPRLLFIWRASESSETLSGLFNRELRIYIIIYVYVIARAGVIFGIYFTSCRYSGG